MKKLLSKFRKNRDGVTAVEAAMLAPVFIPLMLGTTELLFALYASTSLERTLQDTVMELRLGTAATNAGAQGLNAERYLKKRICEGLDFANCQDRLTLDFEIYDSEGNLTSQMQYGFIDPSSLVRVEAKLNLDILGLLGSLKGSPMETKTSLLFYTEPY